MKKKMLFIMATIVAFALFVPSVMAAEVTTKEQFVTAVNNGGEIKLGANIDLSQIVTVPKGVEVVLDLNGKTLSYVSNVPGEAMITNKGSLTITDSTASANGKISFKYVGDVDASHSQGNYTIANSGTLVIENGIVENATDESKRSHVFYTIDNYSVLTVNGGKIVNTYNYAIRQYAGSNQNTVTINNGIVEGTCAVMIQLPGSNTTAKPNVSLNVTGGKLIGTGESIEGYDYKLAVYSYSDGNSLENVLINISGGTLEGDVSLSGGKNKETSELVNITGGQLTDVYSYAEVEDTRIAISGGTFSSGYVLDEYLATDKEYVVTGEGEVILAEEAITFKEYFVVNGELLVDEDGEVIGGEVVLKKGYTFSADEITDLENDLKELEEEVKEEFKEEGYVLLGVFTDKEGKNKADFTKALDENTTWYIIIGEKVEEPVVEPEEKNEELPPKTGTEELPPKTGDVNLALLIGTILVGAAGAVIISKKRFAKSN